MSVDRVSVIGAGDMGHGFAVQFARHGIDVTLVDHRQSNLDEADERIADVTGFLDDEEVLGDDPAAVRDRIALTLDRAGGVGDADLVLETVTEDLDVKHEVFEGVGAAAPDDALLASNTSGLPITEIAAGTPEYADRMVGCHWWFPPYLLRPVEVIRGEETTDAAMDRLVDVVEAVNRDPIVVERDVPGFVWNRVQTAVVRECMHIAEEGVASIDDINRAIRDGYARRTSVIGPFETMDVAGLELFKTVTGELYPHLSDAEEPSALFDERIDAGHGGIADGEGFFEYDEPAEAITRSRDEQLAALDRLFGRRRDD
jgi:3-hydroxyacyl-CoA dehydrogenase